MNFTSYDEKEEKSKKIGINLHWESYLKKLN